ncbi:hypothetical protein EBZ80_23955 [bacterium]|nr:hypothetical protein [bacterium]
MTNTSANAEAFAAEAGATPVVAGVDASTATTSNTFSTNTTGTQFYTDADLARVRAQEKDKLYPQIDKLKEELDALKRVQADKDAQAAAEQAAQESKKAEEAKRKQEEEMELRELLKAKETEWNEQLERERQERERAFALLEREKTFAEVQNYRQTRIDQVRDNIIPELVDLIQGNTIEEIDASIAGLQERSSRILESAQQAMQSARRDMTGTRVTAPQAGPLDINTGNRQFTAEEIAAMPMNEYVKYRQQLLSEKARGRSQGLFG